MSNLPKRLPRSIFEGLSGEAQGRLSTLTYQIKRHVGSAAENIISVGKSLTEAKRILPHGQFCEWLRSEFNWTVRTAQRFMSVAETFKNDNVSHLNMSAGALYLLAAPTTPEAVREELRELAASGDPISLKAVRRALADAESAQEPAADSDDDSLPGPGEPLDASPGGWLRMHRHIHEVLGEPLDAPPPGLIPPTGCGLYGHAPDRRELFIVPSIGRGYVYVTTISPLPDGTPDVVGDQRGTRAEYVERHLRRDGWPVDEATWHLWPCKGWPYNGLLFDSHRDYVDQAILGKPGYTQPAYPPPPVSRVETWGWDENGDEVLLSVEGDSQ